MSITAILSATWSGKGKQPVVDCKQAKQERVMGFVSINPLTEQLVAGFAATGNAKLFKKHLRKVLRKYPDKQKISFSKN